MGEYALVKMHLEHIRNLVIVALDIKLDRDDPSDLKWAILQDRKNRKLQEFEPRAKAKAEGST